MEGEDKNHQKREGSSSKVLTPETRTVKQFWNRPARQNRNTIIIGAPGQEQNPSNPTQLKSDDTHREQNLLQEVLICVREMEGSQFYQMFMNEVHSPKFFNCLNNVLGIESKMPMVIYGIGSIEENENSKWQLSLAILMKRKLSWIGDIEVFDPILSATESQVLQTLGFSVLLENEEGRRVAVKPTFFYMPHCDAELYDNLLQANWGVQLKNIVLFGNSFESYQQHASEFTRSSIYHKAIHVLAAQKFTEEFCIPTVPYAYGIDKAFQGLGWHFFSPDLATQLQLNQT